MNLEKEIHPPVIPRNDELVRNDVGIYASGTTDSHAPLIFENERGSEGRYKF